MSGTKLFLTSGTAYLRVGPVPAPSRAGVACARENGRRIGSGTPLAMCNSFEGMGKTTK
jgi:hypothetical protein